MFFKEYIFKLLPPYFRVTDSYKDEDDKGIMERFLETLGEDLDENFYDKIPELIEVYDPSTEEGKYIRHIAYLLGNIPQGPIPDDLYKKILNNLIYIYKVKGTLESYKRLFYLYNPDLTISISEDFLECVKRDTTFARDTPISKRDICCRNCVDYTLILTYSVATEVDFGLEEDLIKYLISIVEPVNAKLTALVFNAIPTTMETVQVNIAEDLTIRDNSTPVYTA